MPCSPKYISWVLTWNNYPKEWQTQLQPHVTWYIGKPERGEKNGTPHIQGAVQLPEAKTVFQMGQLGKALKCAFQPARGNLQSQYDYIGKIETTDGDMVEWGTNPGDKWKGEETVDWEAIWKSAENGDFDSIPANIRVNKIVQLERIHALGKAKEKKKEEVKDLPAGSGPWGVYIWGPPRTGKTTYVKDNYPDAYEKVYDQYWNDYEGEKYVVFEDIDEEKAKKFGQGDFKNLCDRWKTKVKNKFGIPMTIRPEKILFTSNFHPSVVFGEHWEAMEPRLAVMEFKKKQCPSAHSIQQYTQSQPEPPKKLPRLQDVDKQE